MFDFLENNPDLEMDNDDNGYFLTNENNVKVNYTTDKFKS